jgi:hypothetical protein
VLLIIFLLFIIITINDYPFIFLEIIIFIGNKYRLSVGDLAGAERGPRHVPNGKEMPEYI